MHQTNPHTPRAARGGFTLVELLVAIGVVLVLATVTVTSLQYTANKEKVSKGARDVQSFITGGRDRAIFRRRPTGVRLILDEYGPTNAAGNPITVSSLVYVGSPDPLNGQISIEYDLDAPGHLRKLRFWSPGLNLTDLPGVNNTDDDLDPLGQIDDTGEFDDGTNYPGADDIELVDLRNEFTRLYNLGLLSAGVEITFSPGGTSKLRFTLVGQPGNWALSSNYPAANVSECMNIPFEINLRPAILPNQQPRELPRGVVIDLEASRQNGSNSIPSFWYDPTNNRYSEYMDIIFSPRGVGLGQWTVAGQTHLVFADIEDVEKSYPGGSYDIAQREKIERERVLTVNANSGKASMTDLNFTDPSDLFKFAETGDLLP